MSEVEVKKRKVVQRETITRERVRQIQSHAIGKLRKLMYERGYKFEDFFDDKRKGN
jgi:DNA-directed RNA polymerase sigma subunit (sigma70/sigma32)